MSRRSLQSVVGSQRTTASSRFIVGILLVCVSLLPDTGRAQGVDRSPKRGDLVIEGLGPAIVNARSAALLVSGQEGGPLTSALWAAPVPEVGGASTVLVVLEVDGVPLVESLASQSESGDGDTASAIDVFLYAVGPEGTVHGRATQRFDLGRLHFAAESSRMPNSDQGPDQGPGEGREDNRTGNLVGTLRDSGLKVLLRLDLDPGPYRLRTLVSTGPRTFGLASLDLAVPQPGLALTVPPIAESPPGRWLVAVARGAGLDLFRSSTGGLPAARRVLSTTREHELLLLTSRSTNAKTDSELERKPESGIARVRLRPPLFGPDDDQFEAVATVESLGPDRRGLEALRVRFDPRPLPLGLWDLQVVFVQGERRLDASPPTRVLIDDARAEPPWPQWRPRLVNEATETIAEGRATDGVPQVEPPSKERLATDELTQRVLRVFASLAEPQQKDARLSERSSAEPGRRLAALEATVFDPKIQNSLEILRLAEEAAWRSVIGAVEPKASSEASAADVSAIAELHAQAAIAHLDAGRGGLADHAVRMTIAAAENGGSTATARAREGDPGGTHVALVLTDLALRLAEQRLVEWAASVLETGLRLAPNEPKARFAIASLHELRGDYGAAAQHFERTLELVPGHDEARLRYAVNLGRIGRARKARTLLVDLTDSAEASAHPPGAQASTSWIEVVAFEELARRDLEAGGAGAARRWVSAGLARFPEHPTLLLLDARCLRLLGERAEAHEALRKVDRRSIGRSSSDRDSAVGGERDRYNRLPVADPIQHAMLDEAFRTGASRIARSASAALASAVEAR